MGRILITGPSGSGKTYLADALGLIEDAAVWHTDDAAKLGWSEASEEVAGWLDRPGPWIIEGVAVPRALRKWGVKMGAARVAGVSWQLSPRNRPPPPCDQLIVLRHRRPEAGPAKAGHEAMAKGLFTVLDEVLEGWPELRKVTVYR
jgi:hypothetical protein